jgi:predicted TIM-barrel fold metal-dependent hydrolase
MKPAANGKTKPPHRIDVHHHIFPPEWVQATASHGIGEAGGVAFPAWTPASQIEFMDRNGIAAAITSVAAPGVHFGDDAAARALARTSNEYSARLVSDNPARLGAFAVLPLPDVDGALAEIDYAFGTLEADGVILLASIGDRYLGDPAFDAVFDELNRRKAVVFIHPTVPTTSRALRLAMPGALIEFVFDTTRAVANLIYGGTLERCPDLRIILSHAGGTVPFLTGRLTLGDVVPELRRNAPQGSTTYLKRLYYDTAISANPYALNSLKELVDPSHILFGSDTPYLPEPMVAGQIDGLAGYRGFPDETRAAIERDNGLALFPRLAAAMGSARPGTVRS